MRRVSVSENTAVENTAGQNYQRDGKTTNDTDWIHGIQLRAGLKFLPDGHSYSRARLCMSSYRRPLRDSSLEMNIKRVVCEKKETPARPSPDRTSEDRLSWKSVVFSQVHGGARETARGGFSRVLRMFRLGNRFHFRRGGVCASCTYG